MRAVAMITAAVLVVIGVGVGIVGGLSDTQTFQLPAAKTYALNGVRFSVAFPVPLHRVTQALPPCTTGGQEIADEGQLTIDVTLLGFNFSPSCLSQLGSSGGGFSNSNTAVSFVTNAGCDVVLQGNKFLEAPRFRAAADCNVQTGWDYPEGEITVSIGSKIGLPAAEAVARSFRVLSGGSQ